jgi:hypothetical protein
MKGEEDDWEPRRKGLTVQEEDKRLWSSTSRDDVATTHVLFFLPPENFQWVSN